MQDFNQISNATGKYFVRVFFLAAFVLGFLESLNSVLNFFSLRKSKHFWGVIYDSVTKQPLDPVIVKLLYADTREVATGVTDLDGRYGFLARPGKFKIFARKSNYSFPSKFVTGNSDGIYQNLYHGEFFVLTDDDEVVAPNIPMDPDGADWNQTAKLKVTNSSPFWKLLARRLLALGFWFGLVFCLLGAWRFYLGIPIWLYVLFGLYGLFIVLALILPEPRLWGRVEMKNFQLDGGALFLELRSLRFPTMILGKTTVLENGKFLLRANPGQYLLIVGQINQNQEKIKLAEHKIRVGRAGVFNKSLKITAEFARI